MRIDRREFIRQGAAASAALIFQSRLAAQAAAPPPNLIQSMRNAGAMTAVQTTPLRDTLFLMQGVGGNMVAQTGPDGKLLIDASVNTAATHVKEALEKLGPQHLRLLINTHWHFDHTDGNAAMHDAGAFVIAHENTRLRLSTPQVLQFYNLHFPPSPSSALPQETFAEAEKIYFNNDELDLTHAPAAHTDSDIFIHFANSNVIHTGDLWFNGYYPLIDGGSGGTINGMIRGVDACLTLADDRTKIVPGHGALGNKGSLKNYREMLVEVANRIERLKLSGRPLQDVIQARPTADLDAQWGKGNIKGDDFVTLVYNTL